MYKGELNFGDLQFPISLDDIDVVEELNPKYNWTVFGTMSDDNSVITLRDNDKFKRTQIYLYLIQSDDGNNHYTLIPDFARFCGKNRCICPICMMSIHHMSNESRKEHVDNCDREIQTKVEVTKNKTISYRKHHTSIRLPLYICADFESWMNKKDDDDTKLFEHKLLSYGTYTVCDYDLPEKYQVEHVYRGDDVDERFIHHIIHQSSELVKNVLQNNFPSDKSQDIPPFVDGATECWICKKTRFTKDDGPVKDHDHLKKDRNFRGWAHNSCNLKIGKSERKLAVRVFHNLKGYDSNFIFRALAKMKGLYEFNVSAIPLSISKFITFTINMKKTDDHPFFSIIFMDSLQHLNASLDQLIKNLPESNKTTLYDIDHTKKFS